MIYLVGTGEVDGVWPKVRGYITEALYYCGDLTLAGVYQACRAGQAFLFVTENLDAACVIGFEQHRDCQVARIIALGSETHLNWNGELHHISEFAKSNGAAKLVLTGRKGWGRVLNAEPKTYNYEVEL